MNRRISIETAKLLKENGCKIICKVYYSDGDLKNIARVSANGKIVGQGEEDYAAYHLVNDICQFHPEKFFRVPGYKNMPINKGNIVGYREKNNYMFMDKVRVNIMKLVAKNKIEKAEQYFWMHTIFNPDNK